MELWIRSQNKRRLIKVTQIDFTSSGYYGTMDKQYNILCQDEVWLGSYETKERTLEILDEIENILKPQEYEIPTGRGTYTTSPNISNYVYEMPKE